MNVCAECRCPAEIVETFRRRMQFRCQKQSDQVDQNTRRLRVEHELRLRNPYLKLDVLMQISCSRRSREINIVQETALRDQCAVA